MDRSGSLPGSEETISNHQLEDGARVAVIGGGPAGAFFTYFLYEFAERVGVRLSVDIYEWRDFTARGPGGCNMCGGIVSESLVQMLAVEGLNLGGKVVQRGLDAYVLRMDVGSVRIETPQREMRIAAVHRGGGPRGATQAKWASFDGFLMEMAAQKGACWIRKRVEEVTWENRKPRVQARDTPPQVYDLAVIAIGVNAAANIVEKLKLPYRSPRTAKTYICEFFVGEEEINQRLGNAMQVFMLPIRGLDFAALIPKGDYVTVCLLGQKLDEAVIQEFLARPEVRHCMPSEWNLPEQFCHCSPRINVKSALQPFADRIVFIGDCGTSRLYKDGIGAAYRTAKAAALTSVLYGVSEADFRAHFWPACRKLERDNFLGKIIFAYAHHFQAWKFARYCLLKLIQREQHLPGHRRVMSAILWDMFTGSAPYRDIILRFLNPLFALGIIHQMALALLPRPAHQERSFQCPSKP